MDLAKPGTRLLYMKVGMHAQESLEAILERKRKEIQSVGFAMWGYGGGTCHPSTMVQPFAASSPGIVKLCMQPMTSKHAASPVRASEYSVDRQQWQQIPVAINVLGSRFALCVKDLEEVDESLDLASTEVAVGKKAGRAGDEYIRGRVDKACLVTSPSERRSFREPKPVEIRLTATLTDPYAVFVR